MSLRYALLGLLAYEPASGYDLTQAFTRELGTYAWQAGHTRIYPELNRLADEGLIAVVEQGPRGRRTYDVTAAGRDALRAWLFDPGDDHSVRNEYVLRLFLMSALDSDDTRALLHRKIAEARELIDTLTATIAELDTAAEPGDRPAFGRLAAEFGRRMGQAELEWSQWALENTPDGDQ